MRVIFIFHFHYGASSIMRPLPSVTFSKGRQTIQKGQLGKIAHRCKINKRAMKCSCHSSIEFVLSDKTTVNHRIRPGGLFATMNFWPGAYSREGAYFKFDIFLNSSHKKATQFFQSTRLKNYRQAIS